MWLESQLLWHKGCQSLCSPLSRGGQASSRFIDDEILGKWHRVVTTPENHIPLGQGGMKPTAARDQPTTTSPVFIPHS